MHIHFDLNLASTHERKHTEYLFVSLACFAQHDDNQLSPILQRPWLQFSLQLNKIPLCSCTVFLHPFPYYWRSRLIPSPVVTTAAVGTCRCLCVDFTPSGLFMPRSGAAGPFRVLGLDLEKAPSWVPQWLHYLVFPRAAQGSSSPRILPSAVTVGF